MAESPGRTRRPRRDSSHQAAGDEPAAWADKPLRISVYRLAATGSTCKTSAPSCRPSPRRGEPPSFSPVEGGPCSLTVREGAIRGSSFPRLAPDERITARSMLHASRPGMTTGATGQRSPHNLLESLDEVMPSMGESDPRKRAILAPASITRERLRPGKFRAGSSRERELPQT